MIGNVNVPGALAADIASVSSVANEALNKATQALSSSGSNGSCIVCSTTKPNALKKGLWIKTDLTNKDINITYNFQIQEDDNSFQIQANPDRTSKNSTSACINGKIYTFGGSPYGNEDYNGNTIQCYDPALETFTTMNAKLPGNNTMSIVTTTHMDSYIYNNKVYLFGGIQTYTYSKTISAPSSKILCYDPSNDTLIDTSCTVQPSYDRQHVAGIGNKVYIFGRRFYYSQNDYRIDKNIYCYDINTNTISDTGCDIIYYPHNGSIFVSEGLIYILSGNELQGYSIGTQHEYYKTSTATTKIQCYDPNKNIIFENGHESNITTSDLPILNIHNNAYIFGSGNTYRCDVYNPKIGKTYQRIYNAPNGYYGSAAIDENNNVYIFTANGSKPLWKFNTNDLNVDDSLTDSIVISINNEYFVKCPINKIDQNIYDYRSIDAIYYVDEDNNLHPLEFYRIENYEVAE